MNSIAIIPARGGSVRVPRKNVLPLKGLPLITHTIRQAFDSKVFDKIIVSTEDSEIAEIASKEYASIINRPKPLAEDVETELVLKHVVYTLEERRQRPDIITLLQCTSPMRRPETIFMCVSLLINNWNNMDSVITVNSIEGNRPEWMGSIKENKFIPYTNTWEKEGERFIKLVARQYLPPLYKQNGCVYTFKTDLLMEEDTVIGSRCGAIVIDETESHDIDTEVDFIVAEELMKRYR